jgi:hypothetical protein
LEREVGKSKPDNRPIAKTPASTLIRSAKQFGENNQVLPIPLLT